MRSTTAPSFQTWWEGFCQEHGLNADTKDLVLLHRLITDKIAPLILRDPTSTKPRGELFVTSQWMSYGLPAPVIGYRDSRFELRFTKSPAGNTSVVSVRSKYTVIGSFHQLFPEGECVQTSVAQNLPADWRFGSFVECRDRFTVQLRGDEELFAFFLILVDLVQED